MPERRAPWTAALAVAAALGGAEAWAQAPVAVDPGLPFATRQIVVRSLEAPRTTVATGTTFVAEGESRAGSLVQLGGAIRIEGRVEGDVLAVDSEVTLLPSAAIGGRLTVLGGRFYGTTMADLGEETVWLPDEPIAVEAGPDTVRVVHVPPERLFPIAPRGIFGLVPHEYNRVDGLAFGLEAALRDLEGQPPTELGGGPVLRTERMEEIGWRLAGWRELERPRGLRVGGGVHSITDTAQRWHRADLGNSVAALFAGHDDRVYHERTGYELWVERRWEPMPLVLRLEWRDDDLDSLSSGTPWILFDDDDAWPANPAAEPGRARALGLGLGLERPMDGETGVPGYRLAGRYAHWGFGGDFGFDWGQAEGALHLPVGASFASLRVVAGGRLGGGDTLAPQFLYRLGGAETVIGYDGLSPELTGDRMAIANLRFHLALPGRRFMDRLYLVGLADIGDAWFPDEPIAWNPGVGAGLAALGRRGYLGVFGGYGLESEEWHLYLRAAPWF